jgi:hypothetical protein
MVAFQLTFLIGNLAAFQLVKPPSKSKIMSIPISWRVFAARAERQLLAQNRTNGVFFAKKISL